MSKYIIDIPKTVGMPEKVGSVHCTYFDGIQCKTIILKSDEIEELNSDYINEHYGQLQDEAYQHGYKDCETRYCSFDACPNRQAEYRRGLDDAWEAARKLFSTMADSDIEKAFPTEWNNGGFKALMDLQPQEAIAKLKAYEQKQKADDKIEVGDIVERYLNDKLDSTGIFLGEDGDYWNCLFWTGAVFGTFAYPKNQFKKTGRHFDIASILEDMRND